jgi:hypothetical protein
VKPDPLSTSRGHESIASRTGAALSLGAQALGSLALGALAVGALAVGALAPPHIAAAYGAQDTVAEDAPELSGPATPGTHVKVGSAWKRLAPGQQAPAGQGWIRRGKAFVRAGQ